MKTISLTLAQYRMLGRAIRGEKLPTKNYKSVTASALSRKGCWKPHRGHWAASDLGKKVFAARGLLRAGSQIWNSASPQERAAYNRSQSVGLNALAADDRSLAERLIARLHSAGEVR